MPSESFTSILATFGSRFTKAEQVDQLKAILTQNPNVAFETNNDHEYGSLLHFAASHRSLEFCKLLVEKNPQAVRIRNNDGMLPFHLSCRYCNVQTAKYLFHLYPEGIDISDSADNYPIHLLFMSCIYGEEEEVLELTQFLLQHDAGAVSKPDFFGNYPLHYACEYPSESIVPVALVFNAYPEAIFIQCRLGAAPLDVARRVARLYNNHEKVISFLEAQLDFIRQAREDKRQDCYGNVPIHRVLENENVPVGSVKLMLAANPASISITNNVGMLPIHVACLSGNLDAVKYLVEVDGDSLRVGDGKGNLVLHIACLTGKYDIINFILDQPGHGASMKNADGKLPIQLLLFHANCDRDSLEHMDSVDSLLRAYPAALSFLGTNA